MRQYNEGFLGEQMPRDLSFTVRLLVVGTQTSRDEWAASKQQYSDEYIAFVDAAIREEAQQ